MKQLFAFILTLITISVNAQLSLQVTKTDITCNGSNNGKINILPSGGTAPYTYKWSNNATTQNLTNLNPNKYIVSVTDINNNSKIDSVIISEPSVIFAYRQDVGTKCGGKNGSGMIHVSGGTAPYTYKWSSGETDSIIINKIAAVYYVTVTDKNGCINMSHRPINSSDSVSINAYADNYIYCVGSKVSFSYSSLYSPINYTCIWKGPHGILSTKSNFSIDSIKLQDSGRYYVTVTNQYGCSNTSSTSFKITDIVPTLTLIGDTIICEGSIAKLRIKNPQFGYSYNWDMLDVTPIKTTTYYATAKYGCTRTDSITVVVKPIPISSLNITPQKDMYCENDTILITASGNYNYLWSNNTTTNSLNLPLVYSRTYTVTVTNTFGCSISLPSTFKVENVSLSLTATSLTCHNDSSARIIANLQTCTNPVDYYLVENKKFYGNYIAFLKAGNYHVIATDRLGCSAKDSVTIDNPAISIKIDSVITKNVSCGGYNGTDGEAVIYASSNNSVSFYRWTTIPYDSPKITNMNAGSFLMSAYDLNNCVDTTTITIKKDPGVNIDIISTSNDHCNLYKGAVNYNITGVSSNYTLKCIDEYGWAQNTNKLHGGFYTLHALDNKTGCIGENMFTITSEDNVTANFEYSSSPSNPREFNFYNLTTNTTNWRWVFNDETISYEQNPKYTCEYNGGFDVKLVASNSLCSDSITSYIYINSNNFIPTTTTTVDTCFINKTYPVEKAVFSNFNLIDSTHFSCKLTITQNEKDTTISLVFPFTSNGKTIITAIVKCNGYTNTFNGIVYIENGKVSNSVDEIAGKKLFTIYPNPNNGSFNFQSFLSNGLLEIFDFQGKLCYKNESLPLTETYNIILNNIVSGIYLVKYYNEKEIYVEKMIVR